MILARLTSRPSTSDSTSASKAASSRSSLVSLLVNAKRMGMNWAGLPRPRRALPLVLQARHLDKGPIARRVDHLRRGVEDQIDARLAAEFHIVGKGPGVAREVFVRAELRRVDEDRDDDAGVVPPRGSNEREMAFVQEAQRRHEADATIGARPPATEVRDRPEDVQRAAQASRPSA